MTDLGRPKTDYIYRFNIATDITDKERFIEFEVLLGSDQKTAYLTIVRFFSYIAANCAITANVSKKSWNVISRYCFWDGDPDRLKTALYDSGYIDPDGSVHNWQENQPLAKKKQGDRVETKRSHGGDLSETYRDLSEREIPISGKKSELSVITVPPNPNPNPNPKPKEDKEEEREQVAHDVDKKTFNPDPYKLWWNSLRELKPNLPEVKDISGERLRGLKAIITHKLWNLDEIKKNILSNTFLCRETEYKGEKCTWFDFDFLVGKPLKKGGALRPDNLTKLMEGKYQSMGVKVKPPRPDANGYWYDDPDDPLNDMRNEIFGEGGVLVGIRQPDGSILKVGLGLRP